jgi:uncharacterized protein (TIGR02996 family)
MNEEAGFLNAIRANPADAVARLVYADWLDEHDRDIEASLQRTRAELATLNAPPRLYPITIELGAGAEAVHISGLNLRIENSFATARLSLPVPVPGAVLPALGEYVDFFTGDYRIVTGCYVTNLTWPEPIANVLAAFIVDLRFDPHAKEHPHRSRINELRIAEAYQLRRFGFANPGFPEPL